jgi:branched-chain amino acid transport system permease protein
VGWHLTVRQWDLGAAMLIAGLVGGVAAVVVGYPALRRRGMTLAVSTLAFALFVSSYLLNRSIFDWLPARRIGTPVLFHSIDVSNETRLYFVALGTLALALLMVTGLRRSRTGRVLIAIRENERAAQSYGVNAIRTTMAAFALSGFLAAVAGSLYVHQQTGLSADPYLPQRSLEVFSMVVIGGLGSLPGALLGAVYVQGGHFFLPLEWQFLASGAGLLLILLVFPAGLGAVLAELRDMALRRVALRRGLVVPSLVADVRVPDASEHDHPLPSAGHPSPPPEEPEEPDVPPVETVIEEAAAELATTAAGAESEDVR